jgi:O-acetyl-ADP-ribose deacetylase
MKITIVEGDLVEQQVDCIVNAWNRNVFPWWLLLPQGVSAAIKRKAGLEPFRELRRHGVLPVGGAVLTGPGRLPMKGIIHVAGINLAWRSSEQAIRTSVRSAIDLARAERYRSIAFPLIGAGTVASRRAPRRPSCSLRWVTSTSTARCESSATNQVREREHHPKSRD